jgi:hypothetical protein
MIEGFDGRDVNWKCDAMLKHGLSMYDTVVGCEGYEYPDDPYILEGSCQVEFKLRDTGSYTSSRGYGSSHSYSSLDYSGISFSSLVMVVIFGYILWNIYKNTASSSGSGYSASNHSNPYRPAPSSPYYGNGGGFSSYFPGSYSSSSGPGFWSGMGLGGALGSMWGRRNRFVLRAAYNNVY